MPGRFIDHGIEELVLGHALVGDVPWPEPLQFVCRARRAIAQVARHYPESDLLELIARMPEPVKAEAEKRLIESIASHAGHWNAERYLAVLEALARVRAAADIVAEAAHLGTDDAVLVASNALKGIL